MALAGDTAAALPALDALTDAGLFDGLLEESSATARTMEQLARRHDDRHYLALAYCGQALSAAYGGPTISDVETKLAGLADGSLSPSGWGWVEYTHGELCQAPTHTVLSPITPTPSPSRVPSTIATSKGLRSFQLARCGPRRRSPRGAGRLLRGHPSLDPASQHRPAAHDTAQPRRTVPAPQRTRATRRTSRRRGSGDVPTYGEEAGRLSAAREWAKEKLGPQRFNELTAAAATQDVTAAATTALQLIDELSRTPNHLI